MATGPAAQSDAADTCCGALTDCTGVGAVDAPFIGTATVSGGVGIHVNVALTLHGESGRKVTEFEGTLTELMAARVPLAAQCPVMAATTASWPVAAMEAPEAETRGRAAPETIWAGCSGTTATTS